MNRLTTLAKIKNAVNKPNGGTMKTKNFTKLLIFREKT